MLYLFEDYVLDTDRHELRQRDAVRSVEPQVFDLLVFLVRHRERVVSQDDLLSGVWQGRIVSESTLRSRINATRAAVGDNGEEQRLIRTIPRKGFRFVGQVTEQESRSPHPQPGISGSGDIQPREKAGDASPVREASPRAAQSSEIVTPETPSHLKLSGPPIPADVTPAATGVVASVPPASTALSDPVDVEAGASAATMRGLADVTAPPTAQPSSRRRTLVLASCGAVGAIVVTAAAILLPRSASDISLSQSTTAPAAEKFDPSIVPLLGDEDRRILADYAGRPGFKALAIAPARFGVAEGAPNAEAAQRDALRRCNERSKRACKLYANGMDVLWSKAMLPLPSPDDLRVEPTEHRLVPNDVPLIRDETRKILERHLIAPDNRAVALAASRVYAVNQRRSQGEATRLAVEWCGEIAHKPCLLLSVGSFLTIQIPKSRNVVDIFLPSTQAGFSAADKARIVQVYRGPDWRALAHGSKGTWHPVAGAPSETLAIGAAMAACAKVDEGCQVLAIGNFLVSQR